MFPCLIDKRFGMLVKGKSKCSEGGGRRTMSSRLLWPIIHEKAFPVTDY